MMHGAFDMGTPLFINKLACFLLAILQLSVPITRKGQGCECPSPDPFFCLDFGS